MPNLHPIFVHFTIALYTTSVIFDITGFFIKKESLKTVGWWNFLLATIFAIPTVITGLLAEASLPHTDEAHRLMEIHEILGLILLGTMIALFIWRSINRGSLPTRLTSLFLLLGAMGVGVMLAGGYYGGEMVYAHGMGVAPMMEQMAKGHAHSEHEHGMDENHQDSSLVEEIYSCPMHPEITSEKSGTCSKCGINLEKTHESHKLNQPTKKETHDDDHDHRGHQH